MNVNPAMVSSALPLSLAEGVVEQKQELTPEKQSMTTSRGEVPIIITSHVPDREQSFVSVGGGAEAGHVVYSTAAPELQQVFYPTPTSIPATPIVSSISSTPCPIASVPTYIVTSPATTTSWSASPAAYVPDYALHQQHASMSPRPLYETMSHEMPAQHYRHHSIDYTGPKGGHISGEHHKRVSPEESTGKKLPINEAVSQFVAADLADAVSNVRPPPQEESSNSKDDVSQGAAAITPAAHTVGSPDELKREGHKSGGLHIPRFLRRRRRNSLPAAMEGGSMEREVSDTLSTGSGDNSDNDFSDVEEFDEELDKKLKEEVEKDLPLSITDLSKAERTNVRKVCLLYNPMSGNKRGRRVARKASRLIEREGVAVEMVRLTERGHAEELCETMDFEGIDVVVGVGGDGTFHECINGMMKRKASSRKAAPLALIAAGTGNSFMHELKCFKLKSAIYHILRGVNYPIDICRLTFGDGSSCYSFNSIHWGIASKIMLTAERLRWMGSAMRYTTACFMEIVGGEKAQLAKVVVTDENDKEVEYTDKFIVAIANNIITASRGMKMAPEAKIDDGLIDLLLIKSTSTLNLLDIFRRTYDGSHTDLPYVIYQKVKRFTITPYKESESGQLEEVEEIIDVDGELKGCTPFTCEVLPQTLRIVL